MGLFIPDPSVDWSDLGDENSEFEDLVQIFKWAEKGRSLAAASSLILLQGAADLRMALMTIPTMDKNPNAKARKVTRLVTNNALALRLAQTNFSRLPRKIMSVYEEELSSKNKSRKPLKLH